MRRSLIMVALCLAATLAACSDKKAGPAPASVAPTVAAVPPPAAAPVPAAPVAERLDDTLMSAVFGKKYDPKTGEAVAEIDETATVSKAMYRIRPVQHGVLASGDTVLLAQARLADATAEGNSFQTGWVSIYFLRQEQGKWRVLSRRDDAMHMQRDMTFSASWIKPGKGKEGMALVAVGALRKGCVLEELTLFEFAASAARQLNDAIPVRSSASVDNCTILHWASRWSVQATWQLDAPAKGAAFDDLVLTFSGELDSPPLDAELKVIGPRVKSAVSGTARYVYNAESQSYELAAGENLVPIDDDQHG